MPSHIKVIDIFAGPGGLGEGFSSFRDVEGRKPFNIALSIEKDSFAHATLRLRSFFRQFDVPPDLYYSYLRGQIGLDDLYAAYPAEAKASAREAWLAELGNPRFPSEMVDQRIVEALGHTDNWILIGGPPCQAYSIIGRVRMRGEDASKYEADHRHFLYREYLRIVAQHAPPLFIMENVKGMLSATQAGKNTFERILSDLSDLNYTLYSLVEPAEAGVDCRPEQFIIRSERYGIPQSRHRVIILGIRSDIQVEVRPLKKGKAVRTLQDVLLGLPKIRAMLSAKDSSAGWMSAVRGIRRACQNLADKQFAAHIEESLGQIDESLSAGNKFIPGKYAPDRLSEWLYDSRIGGVTQHHCHSHMDTDFERYFFASCFAEFYGATPRLKDFPRELRPDHENVKGVRNGKYDFADRFRVQINDLPSTTITSHIAKDGHYYIHPDPLQCRSLTVRESARLQTFPDNYYFEGPRTKQYQQVGNAVPPYLAYQIAGATCDILTSANRTPPSNGQPHTQTPKLEHVAHRVARHSA